MKIEIKGPIISDGDQWVYDYFGIPATSPKKVNAALDSAGDVEVVINSGGGSVFAGSEIYTALKSHAGQVLVRVVGVAASAASVIAMAGARVEMSPTAQMMIHRASTCAVGDKNDFEHLSEMLSGIDESIAGAYQLKTKMAAKELLDMMSHETWLTAARAKELGFADEIMFADEFEPVNSVDGMLPQAVIDKVRNTLAEEKPKDTALAKAKARARLTLSTL